MASLPRLRLALPLSLPRLAQRLSPPKQLQFGAFVGFAPTPPTHAVGYHIGRLIFEILFPPKFDHGGPRNEETMVWWYNIVAVGNCDSVVKKAFSSILGIQFKRKLLVNAVSVSLMFCSRASHYEVRRRVPNNVSKKEKYLSLLKGCASMDHLKQIHAQIMLCGLHLDAQGFVSHELVRFCSLSSNGDLNYALLLLNQINHLKPSSWNCIIRGFCDSETPSMSISVFVSMLSRGTKPNNLTFPFLFKACGRHGVTGVGKQIHAQFMKTIFQSNIYILNALLQFYATCSEILDASKVFDEIPVRTIVSWNSMMHGFVRNSYFHEGVRLFERMRFSGVQPDQATMINLLSACAAMGSLSLGRLVHCYIEKRAIPIDVQLGTSLIDLYAKLGAILAAKIVFLRMSDRNVWTWSAMILGFSMNGLAVDALKLFTEMKLSHIKPNEVTFLGVLCACCHSRLVEEGLKYFDSMRNEHRIQPTMLHYNAMVDLFGRNGQLEDAFRFIKSMPIKPNAVVWRTLLSACSIHCNIEVCGEVSKVLLKLERERCGNHIIASNIYAEAGMWDEMAEMRRTMRERALKKTAGTSAMELEGKMHRFISGDNSHPNDKMIQDSLNALSNHLRDEMTWLSSKMYSIPLCQDPKSLIKPDEPFNKHE